MTKYYNLTKMLAAALFRKDSPIIPDGAFPPESQPGLTLARLRTLVGEHRINEGENLLFDMLDPKQHVYAAIALDFYAHVSELTEAELEEADFSVEEIGEGINDVLKTYKIQLVAKNDPRAANAPKIPPEVLIRNIAMANAAQAKNAQTKPPVAPNVLADKPKK